MLRSTYHIFLSVTMGAGFNFETSYCLMFTKKLFKKRIIVYNHSIKLIRGSDKCTQ